MKKIISPRPYRSTLLFVVPSSRSPYSCCCCFWCSVFTGGVVPLDSDVIATTSFSASFGAKVVAGIAAS